MNTYKNVIISKLFAEHSIEAIDDLTTFSKYNVVSAYDKSFKALFDISDKKTAIDWGFMFVYNNKN